MSHVLQDPDCERVVVISHSLGTAVAHDTLLEMARYNRARTNTNYIQGPIPLYKIRHFITLGSPIDKIQYLFESYKTRYHRYRRVVEDLRGDIGEVPFSKNRAPYIHWINYWDEGDIISGALHSPISSKNFLQRVDNVHISNLFFPNPGKSHGAYFHHRRVIGDLSDIIFLNAYNFANAALEPHQGYDYSRLYLGPGDAVGKTKTYALLAITLPWLLLISLSFWFVNSLAAARVAGVLVAGVLGLLVYGYLNGLRRGHRQPLG